MALKRQSRVGLSPAQTAAVPDSSAGSHCDAAVNTRYEALTDNVPPPAYVTPEESFSASASAPVHVAWYAASDDTSNVADDVTDVTLIENNLYEPEGRG